jgi:hypothetical protein
MQPKISNGSKSAESPKCSLQNFTPVWSYQTGFEFTYYLPQKPSRTLPTILSVPKTLATRSSPVIPTGLDDGVGVGKLVGVGVGVGESVGVGVGVLVEVGVGVGVGK